LFSLKTVQKSSNRNRLSPTKSSVSKFITELTERKDGLISQQEFEQLERLYLSYAPHSDQPHNRNNFRSTTYQPSIDSIITTTEKPLKKNWKKTG
jgi:hypothetical protein